MACRTTTERGSSKNWMSCFALMICKKRNKIPLRCWVFWRGGVLICLFCFQVFRVMPWIYMPAHNMQTNALCGQNSLHFWGCDAFCRKRAHPTACTHLKNVQNYRFFLKKIHTHTLVNGFSVSVSTFVLYIQKYTIVFC